MSDNVNHPNHYANTCSLECIEAMEMVFGLSSVLDYCLLNAFKYVWRYKNKNGFEDLQKAEWYVNYGLKKIIESNCVDWDIEDRFRSMSEFVEKLLRSQGDDNGGYKAV